MRLLTESHCFSSQFFLFCVTDHEDDTLLAVAMVTFTVSVGVLIRYWGYYFGWWLAYFTSTAFASIIIEAVIVLGVLMWTLQCKFVMVSFTQNLRY
jgi:hypothetical protein